MNDEKKSVKKGNRIRKPKKGTIIISVMVMVLFISASIYLVVTMLFNVDKIVVTGNTLYENSDLIRTSGIEKGDNLFDIDIKYAEDKLYSVYPYVDEVDVSRSFPNKVIISITEAEPFAAVEDSDGYTLLSKKGKVLERGLENISSSVVSVRGMSTSSNTEENQNKFELLKNIISYMEKLDMHGYDLIDLSDTLDIVLIYQDRIKVELGNELELEYKLQFADNIIDEKIASTGFFLVDASTAGKVMTKELSISPWETLEKVVTNGYADEEEE